MKKIPLFNEYEAYDIKNQGQHIEFIDEAIKEMTQKVFSYAIDNNLSLRDTQQIIQAQVGIDAAFHVIKESFKRQKAERKLLTIQPTPIN